MFNFLKKISLLCIVSAVAVFSSSIQKNLFNPLPFGLTRNNPYSSHQQANALGKETALVWQQTGVTHYNFASIGDPGWIYQLRDTIIYDVAGNKLVTRSSRAQEGWETDSLKSLDSSIYVNGNLSEYFSYYYSQGTIVFGYHYTYTLLDSGKTVVLIIYYWDELKKTWVAEAKYSAKYSVPVNLSTINGYYSSTNLVSEDLFEFDTTNSSWKSSGQMTKIDAECNTTTFVFGGQWNGDVYKATLSFKTSLWSESNVTEMSWIYRGVKNTRLFDSHTNDTLDEYWDYNSTTQTWITASTTRRARTYDANGNNTTTVTSVYDTTDKSWQITSRDVNFFSQADVPVIHFVQLPSLQKVSMSITGAFIRFTAPGITALNLYSATGRLVTSVKQQAAPSIRLDLSNLRSSISAGTYMAELVSRNGKVRSKVSIQP